MFDTKRILADEHAGTLLHRVVRAALADPCQTCVGFDNNDIRALVKRGLFCVRAASGIGGSFVVANASDLCFGERGCGGDSQCRRACTVLEKRPAIHIPTPCYSISSLPAHNGYSWQMDNVGNNSMTNN